MIVTIDGASGTGTTTTALKVAKHLGYPMFSAGNDLRAISYLATQNGAAVKIADGWKLDEAKIEQLAHSDIITDGKGGCSYQNKDISAHLHSHEITSLVALLAQMQSVRTPHDERMQAFARAHNNAVVFEGRRTGHVFPEAIKFWLEAHPDKAFARVAQQRGEHIAALNARRNELDANRSVAPSVPADGAIIIDTTDFGEDGAYQAIIKTLEQKVL